MKELIFIKIQNPQNNQWWNKQYFYIKIYKNFLNNINF